MREIERSESGERERMNKLDYFIFAIELQYHHKFVMTLWHNCKFFYK